MSNQDIINLCNDVKNVTSLLVVIGGVACFVFGRARR